MNLTSNISSRNPYKLEKHRYLELRHFCLQYPSFKEAMKCVNYHAKDTDEWSDISGETASLLSDLSHAVSLIESSAKNADKVLAPYILLSATKDISYSCLASKYEIPAGPDMFYDRLRKFYFLLHIQKGI